MSNLSLNTPAKAKTFAKVVQDQYKQITDLNNDYDKWIKENDDLYAQVQEAQKSLPKGLCVGRLVEFGVADGHASYIVTKVGKKTCKVEHLPFGDGYRFRGVVNGEVLTGSIYI